MKNFILKVRKFTNGDTFTVDGKKFVVKKWDEEGFYLTVKAKEVSETITDSGSYFLEDKK